MRLLFGTDGIRGPAGAFPLDPATVSRVGHALVKTLLLEGVTDPHVLAGCDTRESSLPIAAALAAGIQAAGGRLSFAGVVPTPAVAHLVRATGAHAGVSISASHNPWQDNGIKVFSGAGRKLPDRVELELETEIDRAPAAAASGPPENDRALAGLYVDHLVASIPHHLDGLTVVIDAAHGAAFQVAVEAFRRSGARVVPIAVAPDGRNINAGCGALHPDVMAAETRRAGADLGLALDGDADRALLSDGRGEILDGDDILYLWTRALVAEGRRPEAVVGTVMSNWGLEKALEDLGVELVRTAVGDRYVTEMMERRQLLLGGEPSGHLIRADLTTTGDGTLTGLLVAASVAASATPLAAQPRIRRTPQVLRNVRVRERLPFGTIPGFATLLSACEARVAGHGRILLRYSGTEPLARVMVEADDRALVETIAASLTDALEQAVGAAGAAPSAR